jgi:imidazolonepropionase-like amidohydrolase
MEPLVPHPGRPDGVCDGVEGARTKIRQLDRAGADVVRIYATGFVASPGIEMPPLFSQEELTTMVGEARSRGLPVVAHCHGSVGAVMAAKAGVAGIERGVNLDARSAAALAKNGVYLVPTLSASAAAVEMAGDGPNRDRAKRIFDAHLQSVRRAVKEGVKIALGSGAGPVPHGEALTELLLLSEAGLSATEAIAAATVNGADLLGAKGELGSIQKGKRADLLLLRKNPLEDLSSPADRENTGLIMKDGEIVHRVM